MKEGKFSGNLADQGRKPTTSDAVKVAFAILGVGVAMGTALVVSMNQIMKRIFVSDSWPEEEWSNNDWAGEDLE
ncbi:MAG: hypothetical protein IJS33_04560 [Firmicutes bacterium]|nr:hypothetical protein [Bacillota bacterium]